MRLLLIFSFLVTTKTFGQTCNCSQALTDAVSIITTNYAGYKDKVRADNNADYIAYTDSFHRLALDPKYQLEVNCANLIRSWRSYFKDGHVQVFVSGNTAGSSKPVNADSIRRVYADAERVAMTEAEYKKYLLSRKKLHPMEAIWWSEDRMYKIGIKEEATGLRAFILQADSVYWTPGQIKIKFYKNNDQLTADYYMQDHSVRKADVGLYDDNTVLMGSGLGIWNKVDVHTGLLANKNYYPNNTIVRFKKLSDKTNLITIKTFNESYRSLVDSIIKANHHLIASTENLIIDVRGNGGGSDYSFYPLKKYLFTHPYQRVTSELLCSEENTERYRRLALDTFFTKEERSSFLERAQQMSLHRNEFWSSSPVYINSDTLVVLPYPKRVAVVIDGNCASTTEQFLLDPVLNSSKAIIYGKPSAGILDYANMNNLSIPNTNIRVAYATSRSRRIDLGKGIDNKGVQPHVAIGDDVKDWITFVQKDIESKSK